MDLAEAHEVSVALRGEGVHAERVAAILGLVASTRAHAEEIGGLSLSRKRYDEWRLRILQEIGLASRKGSSPWPPTSQTVMKRMGGGFWAEAMKSVGLIPGAHGRSRGLLMFVEQDYNDAVTDYLAHAANSGQASTVHGYSRWVEVEERAGRRRPAPASLRRKYGSCTNAKRIITASGFRPLGRDPRLILSQTVVARDALHHAQSELGQFLERVAAARPAEASSNITTFLRSFVEEFEIRRRDWLRTIVALDEGAVARRLTSPAGLKRARREALTKRPTDLTAVLTDRYIDTMLSGGDPRQTDGWLRPEAQAQLSALPDEIAQRFAVLRCARNFLTHDSEEARGKLQDSIGRLAAMDPRFSLKQPMTRRVLVGWLHAENLQRMRLLCESVPAAWRAMVVVETVSAESPEA
ncbi:MAG: hypothetical protein M3O70_19935 [Actinomycetota bacterium]|nr:hypothetical protein [Actinomycetota bacterium]